MRDYKRGVFSADKRETLATNNKIKQGSRFLVFYFTFRYSSQARPLLKDRNYPDLIDPRNVDSHDVHQLFCMVRVAEKCLTRDPHKRLTMDKVRPHD